VQQQESQEDLVTAFDI
jgi:tryptophanyl-tRNA synthetase